MTLRVTDAELEMIRAATDALRVEMRDVLLCGVIATGADIVNRWAGPWTPEIVRAERAFHALQQEYARMRDSTPSQHRSATFLRSAVQNAGEASRAHAKLAAES